jgi:hypothetical protein
VSTHHELSGRWSSRNGGEQARKLVNAGSALTFVLHLLRLGCAALSIIAQNKWIWLG